MNANTDNPDLLADENLSQRDIETKAAMSNIAADKNTELLKSKVDAAKQKRKKTIKKQQDESYKKTLKRVQGELSSTNRIISKILHNKIVEKISDIISVTIARPNAILLGSIVAFIFTLLTYSLSKKIGYTLSGYETITAFIFGWMIGIVYDYLRLLMLGKK